MQRRTIPATRKKSPRWDPSRKIRWMSVVIWIEKCESEHLKCHAAQPVSDVMFLLPFSVKSRRKPLLAFQQMCVSSQETPFPSPQGCFFISIKAIFISPEVIYLLRGHFHLPRGVFNISPLNPPHNRKWERREEISSMDWLNDNQWWWPQ